MNKDMEGGKHGTYLTSVLETSGTMVRSSSCRIKSSGLQKTKQQQQQKHPGHTSGQLSQISADKTWQSCL